MKAASPILFTLSGIMVFWQPLISVLVAVWIIALHCSRLSYTVLPSATTMEVREEQSSKAVSPILVTPFPITMEVRESQPPKAASPILVTPLPITMDLRATQDKKASFSILVTLSGIVMEVRESHWLKTLPILVTPSGIMVFLQTDISLLVAVSIIALH